VLSCPRVPFPPLLPCCLPSFAALPASTRSCTHVFCCPSSQHLMLHPCLLLPFQPALDAAPMRQSWSEPRLQARQRGSSSSVHLCLRSELTIMSCVDGGRPLWPLGLALALTKRESVHAGGRRLRLRRGGRCTACARRAWMAVSSSCGRCGR